MAECNPGDTMKTKTERKVRCRLCRYVWIPRTRGLPRECPFCKRHDYFKKRVKK